MSDRWTDLLYYGIAGMLIVVAIVMIVAISIVIGIYRDVKRDKASGALRNHPMRRSRRH